MAEPSSFSSVQTRAERVAREALRARVTIGLSGLALLAAAVSLMRDVASPQTVGTVLGFVALFLLLAQIALRSFLVHLSAEEAAAELQIIRRNTEEELRSEQKQTMQLELLLTAMREFSLIEVDSINALDASRPTTAFYLQRHGTAIVKILGGHWKRSELLRPEQLWHEYKELVTRMKKGETFRSTVCLPTDLAVLLEDSDFNDYVEAIYKAAKSQQVEVRRLFVLNSQDWPPPKDSLEPELQKHLRALAELERSTAALEARVTSASIAAGHFALRPPDFMMWGDGLLIVSDLNAPDELVTRAEFYFASNNHSEEIAQRQKEFDKLFADPKKALPLTDVV